MITIIGANPSIQAGSTYNDAGATASDNLDGNITLLINKTSNVNTSNLGTYYVTYNVTDTQGNVAVTKIRTVNAIDTTKPIITLAGDSNVTTEYLSV